MRGNETLVLVLPRGRILEEVTPLLKRAGIAIEPAFDDPASRQLRFRTNHAGLDVIRVRSFDVATFVAFGAAQLGVAGSDVLMEFSYPEIYVPLDLNIGRCRLVVAAPKEDAQRDDEPASLILDFAGGSSVRLEVAQILCHLDDLGEPWPTRWRPKHPVADAG